MAEFQSLNLYLLLAVYDKLIPFWLISNTEVGVSRVFSSKQKQEFKFEICV